MLKYRQQGLGHPRVWAASVLFLAAVFGILSFFSAQQGTMAYFTLDGVYGLGGKLGHWISGIDGGTASGIGYTLATMRVAVVTLAGVALVSPVLAFAAGEIALAVLTYLYIRFVMVMRAGFARLSERSRSKPAEAPAAAAIQEDAFPTDAASQESEWRDIPAKPMFDTSMSGGGASLGDTPSTAPAFAGASASSFGDAPSATPAFEDMPGAAPAFAEAPDRRAVFGGMATAATLERAVQADVEEAEDEAGLGVVAANGSYAPQAEPRSPHRRSRPRRRSPRSRLSNPRTSSRWSGGSTGSGRCPARTRRASRKMRKRRRCR